MSHKYSFILLYLLGILLQGCAGIYSVVEFEVLEPATVSFPDHVNRLIILNRAPVTYDAFREEDTKGMTPNQLLVLDTLIVNSLNQGVRVVLQQSPIARFHFPIWLDDRREDTAMLDELVLTKREVNAICAEYSGDAVISLESYFMDIDYQVIYWADDPGEIQASYYEISGTLQWNIYLPDNPRPFDTYCITDTLFFPEIADGIFEGYNSVPSIVRRAFHTLGTRYGRYLVPIWVHTSRAIYKGREDSLRIASKLTNQGDWDQAYAIWKNLSDNGDSTIVAKALNNMAVFHELEDHLDSARTLVTRALEYDTLAQIRIYKEELDTRVLNREEILKQLE